jgi:hypothetical protein
MPAMAYMGGRTEVIGCCLDFFCVLAGLRFGLGVLRDLLYQLKMTLLVGNGVLLSWDISWMEGLELCK